jgi:hypothetical protein
MVNQVMIFEVMPSTWPSGTLGSVASLLVAAILYQGNQELYI